MVNGALGVLDPHTVLMPPEPAKEFREDIAGEFYGIGAFLSVTGPAAFLGDPELKTMELYVERINAEGGVLGRKLQLVAYDDAGDAEKARTFAKRLLEQDKVDVIVGGSTTGATLEAAPW